MKFLKYLMETKNKDLVNYVQEKIIKRMADWAAYKKESSAINRGETIFNKRIPDRE